jgi:hypothetical protein
MKFFQVLGIALSLFWINAPAQGEGAPSKESLDAEVHLLQREFPDSLQISTRNPEDIERVKEAMYLEVKTNDQGKTFTLTFIVNDQENCLLTPKTVALAAPMRSAQIGIPTPPMGRVGFETNRAPCKIFPGPSRGEITFVFGNSLPSVKAGYYVLFIDGQTMGKILLIDSKGNPSLIEPNAIPQ